MTPSTALQDRLVVRVRGWDMRLLALYSLVPLCSRHIVEPYVYFVRRLGDCFDSVNQQMEEILYSVHLAILQIDVKFQPTL